MTREHEHRQRDAGAFAPRERGRLALDLVAGEPEAAEMALDDPSLPLRPQVGDDVVDRLVQRDLAHVLAVIARIDG